MERHLIAGDIHGQYESLREALDKASFNPDTDILYSTGDISDRGPGMVLLVRYLMSLPDYRPVLGNHDIWLRDYLVSDSRPAVWVDGNGGRETIRDFDSHGVGRKEKERMGEWLASAPYVRIEDKYIITHGGIPKGWGMKELESLSKLRMRLIGYAIAEEPSSSPLWNRSYLQSAMAAEHGADPKVLDPPLDTDKTIFIGHTPLDKPFHSGIYHLRAVDTGAGHGRSLTVMDMDTGEFWQA